MNVTITPACLEGTVKAPASKSEAHRLLICAALSPETCDIDCDTTSQDIDATAECLRALGAQVTRTRLGFRVVPIPRDETGRPRARRGAASHQGVRPPRDGLRLRERPGRQLQHH